MILISSILLIIAIIHLLLSNCWKAWHFKKELGDAFVEHAAELVVELGDGVLRELAGHLQLLGPQPGVLAK